MATHVDHRVDRAGTTDDLAARQLDSPTVALWFRLSLHVPIERRSFEHRVHASWDMNHRVPVPAPGFQQQHLLCATFAELVGEETAGRSGAYNDVVIFALQCRITPAAECRPHTVQDPCNPRHSHVRTQLDQVPTYVTMPGHCLRR